MSVSKNVSLSNDVIEQITQVMERENRTFSNAVETLVLEALKEREKKNGTQ